MNIIPCSLNCKFQDDGYCNLEHTASVSNCGEIGCAYYISKTTESHDQVESFTDIAGSNNLYPFRM